MATDAQLATLLAEKLDAILTRQRRKATISVDVVKHPWYVGRITAFEEVRNEMLKDALDELNGRGASPPPQEKSD